jgi:uncharacterized membrane protein
MMARTVSCMFASFFVGALVSKADAWNGLLLFFVHVMDGEDCAGRSCKGYSRGRGKEATEHNQGEREGAEVRG